MSPGFSTGKVRTSGWGPSRQVPSEGPRSREIRRKRVAPFWRAMFQVSVEETFSAAHALRGYRGKCENVHGHNYRVRVTLEGAQLDSSGFLVNLTGLKQVTREIMGRLDHQLMTDPEPLKTVNPSAKNVAKYFY